MPIPSRVWQQRHRYDHRIIGIWRWRHQHDSMVILMTIGNIRDSSVVITYVTIVYPRARVVTAVINLIHDASVIHYWVCVIGSVVGLLIGLVVGLVLGLIVGCVTRYAVVNPWLEQVVSKVEHLVSNHGLVFSTTNHAEHPAIDHVPNPTTNPTAAPTTKPTTDPVRTSQSCMTLPS